MAEENAAKAQIAPASTEPTLETKHAPEPEDPTSNEEPDVTTEQRTSSEWLGIVFVLVVGSVIVGTWIVNSLGVGRPTLEVVTSASLTDTTNTSPWVLSGFVLMDGSQVAGSEVWAVATDARGNRYSPGLVHTDSSGRFRFVPIPRKLGVADTIEVVEARVFAKAQIPRGEGKNRTVATFRGRDVLRLSSRGQLRWVDFSSNTMVLLWLLPALFLLTIVLALLQARPDGTLLKLQYYGSVLLAFFFTLAMLGSVGLGLRDVNISGARAEVLTVGFASIYQGTYVSTVGSDWLFSLTSPNPVETLNGLVHGFGAPLWVIFISILGAAVFTISIFVTHVKERIDFRKADDIRERIEQIVRHQFYILFSPLGAVIVYQLLVVGGAASEQVTVAIAAMAAGISLNPILDRALRSVGVLVKGEDVSAAGKVGAKSGHGEGGEAGESKVGPTPNPQQPPDDPDF